MKKLLLLFALIIVSNYLFAQFKNNAVGQIPIIAWGGVVPDESTEARYAEMVQAGITHNISLFENVDQLAIAMESAKKTGVKMIIYCPEIRTNPEMVVNRFKDHPALAGYLLYDEPKVAEFPKVIDLMKRIQALDSDHFCYVNHFAVDFLSRSLEHRSFKGAVSEMIRNTTLPLISYDYYPIIEDRSGNRKMAEQMYENLEFYSKEAQNVNKPFWAFALTVAIDEYYPVPTKEGLRLQVFSNLAYGAQGIQYFTYWTPKQRGSKNFYSGPIDRNTGKQTNVYNHIQQISSEIKGLSPVFLGAQLESVSHTGAKIPRGTRRLNPKTLPDVITKFGTEGLGAVVSVMKNGNKSYLVVVNRDFKKAMTLTIEGDNRLTRVLKDGTTEKVNDSKSKISIDPGDVTIFGW